MHGRRNERQEQRHLDRSTGCLQGLEEYKWAGTQSTYKGLVRGDWKEGEGMTS